VTSCLFGQSISTRCSNLGNWTANQLVCFPIPIQASVVSNKAFDFLKQQIEDRKRRNIEEPTSSDTSHRSTVRHHSAYTPPSLHSSPLRTADTQQTSTLSGIVPAYSHRRASQAISTSWLLAVRPDVCWNPRTVGEIARDARSDEGISKGLTGEQACRAS
jgi:hypothetical protein